jgi:hypothetical protein
MLDARPLLKRTLLVGIPILVDCRRSRGMGLPSLGAERIRFASPASGSTPGGSIGPASRYSRPSTRSRTSPPRGAWRRSWRGGRETRPGPWRMRGRRLRWAVIAPTMSWPGPRRRSFQTTRRRRSRPWATWTGPRGRGRPAPCASPARWTVARRASPRRGMHSRPRSRSMGWAPPSTRSRSASCACRRAHRPTGPGACHSSRNGPPTATGAPRPSGPSCRTRLRTVSWRRRLAGRTSCGGTRVSRSAIFPRA